MLPKTAVKYGSRHNELDANKRAYIIKMRQSFLDTNNDIFFEDGSLNFKYFNVKKGHYWSKTTNEKLTDAIIKHGVTSFKLIKQHENAFKEHWSETEIRLRICRLLKTNNLKPYEGRKFASAEEVLEEAARNKKEAHDTKKSVGGILYVPPAEEEGGIYHSIFNTRNAAAQAKQQTQQK